MKKLLAAAMAVLTVAVMSGCGNTADRQLIEDITDDISTASETELPETSVTEADTEIPETVSGTAEAAAETETSEEETEIVSDTETAVEEETVTETMAEADFPIGKWIETRAYIYEFDENGNVSVDTGFYNIKGTYEYNGSELRLRLISGWNEPVGYVFSVTENGDSAKLVYTDYFDTEYMDPYEPVGLVSGYFSVLGGIEEITLEPFRNELVYAEHEDLNGAWISSDFRYNYYPDEMYVYNGNSWAFYHHNGFINKGEFHVKNGYEILDEPYSFDVHIDGREETADYRRSYMIYGDKLYVSNNIEPNPDILVRYVQKNISEDYFNDASYYATDGIKGIFTLKDGKGIFEPRVEDEDAKAAEEKAQITVNGNKLLIRTDSFKGEYDYYLINDDVFLYNSNDDYILLSKMTGNWPFP